MGTICGNFIKTQCQSKIHRDRNIELTKKENDWYRFFRNNVQQHKKFANVDQFDILCISNKKHEKLLNIILDGTDLDMNHKENIKYPIQQSVAILDDDHKATEMTIQYGADIGVKETENQS